MTEGRIEEALAQQQNESPKILAGIRGQCESCGDITFVELIPSADNECEHHAVCLPCLVSDRSTGDRDFIDSFNALAERAHETAVSKGWWENEDAELLLNVSQMDGLTMSDSAKLELLAANLRRRNDGEMLALIHSEVSEALEALRAGNPPDDKIPEFSGVEAELADVIIRIFDLSQARGWKVAEAIVAKMEMNETRSHKHGGKEF